MALEMFVKIEGVVGGTKNYQHKGWADMLSWNWNLERVPAEQATETCENMNQISILKALGRESAAMLQLFAENKPISRVEISAIPVVGKREAAQKYLSIVMEDVAIVSIRADGEAEENYFRERWILQFDKVKFEIYEHAATNAGADATAPENFAFAWDLAKNTLQ